MTEAEWAVSDDPVTMLQHVQGKVSRRKVRLFACACVRQIWHLLTDKRSRQVVEAAERYANGLVSEQELDAAWSAARSAARHGALIAAQSPVATCAAWSAAWSTWDAVWCDAPAGAADGVARAIWDATWRAAWYAACGVQAALLRCIVGNPFRPPSARGEDNSHWHAALESFSLLRTPLIVGLAQAAYEQRRDDGTLDPEHLAVLSDALEQAGCDNVDVLTHLRSSGPHVRGCHAVDLCLGRS